MTLLATARAYLAPLRRGHWRASWTAARTLWFDYGHLRSALTQSSIDRDGPVPWYTYPAILYLKQLDFSDSTIFEYGSGNSTLFWAAGAKRVISVEEDPNWYDINRTRIPSNCELLLETDLQQYADAISRWNTTFDVIAIDGAARAQTRLKCAKAALPYLRDGGMIILDNSDWLPESARLLRDAGLIQIDMTGFTPIGAHTQTTSLFLHRSFDFRPKGSRQPMPGPGAQLNVWEHPAYTSPPRVDCDGEVFGGVTRDELFEFASPAGTRAFRLIVAEAPPNGIRTGAIIDVQAARVLISLTERLDGDAWVERELQQSLQSDWNAFTRYINAHDKRRYDLASAESRIA
jgi:hypothetical protein